MRVRCMKTCRMKVRRSVKRCAPGHVFVSRCSQYNPDIYLHNARHGLRENAVTSCAGHSWRIHWQDFSTAHAITPLSSSPNTSTFITRDVAFTQFFDGASEYRFHWHSSLHFTSRHLNSFNITSLAPQRLTRARCRPTPFSSQPLAP